LIVHIKIKI